jgi:hypothetical protein
MNLALIWRFVKCCCTEFHENVTKEVAIYTKSQTDKGTDKDGRSSHTRRYLLMITAF